MILYLLACMAPTEPEINEALEQSVMENFETEEESKLREQSKTLFGTIDSLPYEEPATELVTLGYLLYQEKALSGNGKQSCESCHLLDNGGAEPFRVSTGAFGKPVERNAPSTFNSGFHIAQFWDGRAATLEEQAGGPILAAGEMGMPTKQAAEFALDSDFYRKLFREAFPGEQDPIKFDNITAAIAAYEKTLVTEDRFDGWMKGEDELTDREQEGLKLFIGSGCAGCHNGALLGANSYQKVGVIEPYRPEGSDHVDYGRYNVTGVESDKEVFKVPSLRNVGATAPYFHDGRVPDLTDAIALMGKIQLGKEFTEQEVLAIKSFLLTTKNEKVFK